MLRSTTSIPEMLPVLSRGKHRNPRRGACFMEFASFLAGERWSDHPACTHPLLAEVARNVNDLTSDSGRPLLASLIPSVVGLSTDDPRADARIALHCALTALPVASFERQRSLAVGMIACERQLVALGDPQAGGLREHARRALEDVPDAARWAVTFPARAGAEQQHTSPRRFRRYSAPSIVNVSVRGVAEAVVASHDSLLRTMLEGSIEQCRALRDAAAPSEVRGDRRRDACVLTH